MEVTCLMNRDSRSSSAVILRPHISASFAFAHPTERGDVSSGRGVRTLPSKRTLIDESDTGSSLRNDA